MSPSFKRTGVLLVSGALAIGLWGPSAATADYDDNPAGSIDPDVLEDLDPEDLEGFDLDFTREPGAFSTWGSSVNVRSGPSTDADVVRVLTEPTSIEVACQEQGELVSAEGYTNDWWAYVPDLDGYLSNIYVDTPDAVLPDVPSCYDDGMPPLTPDDLEAPDDDTPLLGPDDLGTTDGFTTWGSNVNVRSGPTTDADVVEVLDGPTPVEVSCQMQGELVSADGYTNDWWAKIPDLGGFVSNIYIDVPGAELPGVPNCSEAEQGANPTPEPDNSTTKPPRCTTTKLRYQPLDDRLAAEIGILTQLGPVDGAAMLAHIYAVNALDWTVALGHKLAGSLGISGLGGSYGAFFGPDGSFGRFVSGGGFFTTPAVSISLGFEETILFGRAKEKLDGEAYVVEVSGGWYGADLGAKAIVSTDGTSVNGLAVSVGIGAGMPPISASFAKEWTELYDPPSSLEWCDE